MRPNPPKVSDDLSDKLITRHLHAHIKELNEAHDYLEYVEKPMERSEWMNWEPEEDDIYSLVESIKYWSQTAYPKRPRSEWGEVDMALAVKCKEKELVCLELLGKCMDKYDNKSFSKLKW